MAVKTKIIILLCFLFLITNVSALTFPKDSDAQIKNEIRLDGALPPVGTLCNISVYYPNNTILVDFESMTNQGDYFNYTLNSTQTSLRGDYTYCVTCTGGSTNATECFPFTINLGGIEPSQIRTDSSTRTIYIFFGFGILTFFGFLFSKKVPIKISLFLFMIWFFLMGINTTYISMQDEIINSNIESFFSFFLAISYYMNYFIFISLILLWVVTFIVNIFEGHKNELERKY